MEQSVSHNLFAWTGCEELGVRDGVGDVGLKEVLPQASRRLIRAPRTRTCTSKAIPSGTLVAGVRPTLISRSYS